MLAQFVNALRHQARPHAPRNGLRVDGVDFGIAARFTHLRDPVVGKRHVVDLVDGVMAEERFGHDAAALGGPVHLPGEIETGVAQALQHRDPLRRFQRDAVGARQPRRDKADVFGHLVTSRLIAPQPHT